MRDGCKYYYAKYDFALRPLWKFFLMLTVLTVINGSWGYMAKVDNIFLVLMLSLLSSFLPLGFMVLASAGLTLLHFYALSLEVAAIGLALYIILYLVFVRLSARESIVVLITPLLFLWKIPYVLPVALGLLCGPSVLAPLLSGILVYFFLEQLAANAAVIGTMASGEAIAKIRLILDAYVDNKAMPVVVVSFALCLLLVYFLRRLPVDHAWSISLVVGTLANLVMLLVGDLALDAGLSMISIVICSLLAVVSGKVLELFCFGVDYSRAEKVQFEDEEYYYYVRAIPKWTVSAPERTVKQINPSRQTAYREGRPRRGTRPRE